MHNQRRDEYKARLKDDATATKLATKASQWHMLTSQLLKRRKDVLQTAATDTKMTTSSSEAVVDVVNETLKLTDKLLSVNPDPIYLWNYRRELLLLSSFPNNNNSDGDNNSNNNNDDQYYSSSNDNDIANVKAFIKQEQIVTQTALERNPKAYGAWFHRKWSIHQFVVMVVRNEDLECAGHTMNTTPTLDLCKQILQGELILCSEFLSLDQRNFHCWNYRRFIVSMLIYVQALQLQDASTTTIGVLDGNWNFLSFSDDNDDDERLQIPIIGPQISNTASTTTNTSNREEKVDANVSSASSSPPLSTSTSVRQQRMKQIQSILLKEWQFTSEKIIDNFSNGSAFHYRSKLLPLLLYIDEQIASLSSSSSSFTTTTTKPIKTKAEWLEEELELIRNAIFTEPDDQTAWWYFRFILAWANPCTDPSLSNNEKEEYTKDLLEEFKQVLYQEWTSIQELVDAEDGKCKWGLLGLYMISMIFVEMQIVEYENENWLELSTSYLEVLIVLDPDRTCRYEAMKNNSRN